MMHNSIINNINSKGLKVRKVGELLRSFENYYNDLMREGFIKRLVILDKEMSKKLVQLFAQHK